MNNGYLRAGALLLLGVPAFTQPPDALMQARAEVAARRQAWQTAHQRAWSAAITKAGCSPEFAGLLHDAREAADRWVLAVARGVDIWAIRRRTVARSYRPPEFAVPSEVAGFQEAAAKEKSVAERRLAALTSTLALERASGEAAPPLARLAAEAQSAVVTAEAAVSQIPAAPADDDMAESLLSAVQEPRKEDLAWFKEFYDQLESMAKQRCEARPERPDEPFSLPARKGTKQ